MKSFLISLGTIALATTPVLASNFYQTNNLFTKINNTNLETEQITITLSNYNKDFVSAVYQPNNSRASFHYIDITKRIVKENLNESCIIFEKINFDHRQTEIHTKIFDSLGANNNIFKSATLGNPAYWNDQTFYEHTSILYNDTISEGVTRYNAQLSTGLTKDINTGKIYFVWGVFGHVVLGSNQAIVSSQVKSVVIKY